MRSRVRAAAGAVFRRVRVTGIPVPSFNLPFPDAGNGAVSIVPAAGGVSGTFTRATAATTVNSSGLIVSVSSGVARSYYDPTSLSYLGYLAEGARTNLTIRSQELNNTTSAWTAPTRASVSADATTAPDGTATADKLVEDSTAANTHFIQQAFSKASSAITYAVTAFVKQAGRTWVTVQANDGSNAATCSFDVANGATGISSANGTYAVVSKSIKAFPNGWYRIEFVYTTPATASDALIIFLAEADNDVTYSGDGTSGLFIWGVQKEAGAFASSYIPTTNATVTRNADVLTYPASVISDTQGTLVGEFYAQNLYDTVVFIGGSAENIQMIDATANGRASYFDGVNNPFVLAGSFLPSTRTKSAVAWSGSSAVLACAGQVSASQSYDGSWNLTALEIGGVVGSQMPFGTISSITAYPSRLPNATLQRLTA